VSEAAVIDVVRQALWVMLKVGAPILILSLAVGLIISFAQALTQIQEVTLTFVPKMILVFMALVILAPFMLHTLRDFTAGLFARIAAVP
jgi:flagellar biosynthetic protein FliQ